MSGIAEIDYAISGFGNDAGHLVGIVAGLWVLECRTNAGNSSWHAPVDLLVNQLAGRPDLATAHFANKPQSFELLAIVLKNAKPNRTPLIIVAMAEELRTALFLCLTQN